MISLQLVDLLKSLNKYFIIAIPAILHVISPSSIITSVDCLANTDLPRVAVAGLSRFSSVLVQFSSIWLHPLIGTMLLFSCHLEALCICSCPQENPHQVVVHDPHLFQMFAVF